jgi:hypothetical protein
MVGRTHTIFYHSNSTGFNNITGTRVYVGACQKLATICAIYEAVRFFLILGLTAFGHTTSYLDLRRNDGSLLIQSNLVPSGAPQVEVLFSKDRGT